jgi:hypothetical protein
MIRWGWLVFAVVLVGSVVGSLRFLPGVVARGFSVLSVPTPTAAPNKETVAVAQMDSVVIQQKTGARSAWRCNQGRCKPVRVPASDTIDAVADGSSWYRYAGHTLERVATGDGKVETIIDETPLVRPRDMVISPNGQYVLFWLDNIDRPTERLTELWMYDAQARHTRLLVEKMRQDEVVGRLRWNRASSRVFYAAADGSLHVVDVTTTNAVKQLSLANVAALGTLASRVPFDVSRDGTRVAYAVPNPVTGRDELVVSKASSVTDNPTQGRVVYVQWFDNGSLLFATQDQSGFTFWQTQGEVFKQVVRHEGQLQSVLADAGEAYLMFAAGHIFSYDLVANKLADEGAVPPSEATFLVWAAQVAAPTPSAFSLPHNDDSELVAFIDTNLRDITGSHAAHATQILMTDQSNTFYVTYTDGGSKRVLMTVYDVVDAEWSIRARYEEKNAEWQKVEGGGLSDPKPVRLYEWEPSVKQWILNSGTGQSH